MLEGAPSLNILRVDPPDNARDYDDERKKSRRRTLGKYHSRQTDDCVSVIKFSRRKDATFRSADATRQSREDFASPDDPRLNSRRTQPPARRFGASPKARYS